MRLIPFYCLSSNLTLTLKLLNSEFVAQTEALKYHLPQIIIPNGKVISHLSLISRAKKAFTSYLIVNFYCPTNVDKDKVHPPMRKNIKKIIREKNT